MLQIKTYCENCHAHLPNGSREAMICTFECTFCAKCVDTVLFNVCPNCGGGFEKRPTRPTQWLEKYPINENKPVSSPDFSKHKEFLILYKDIDPAKR